MATTDKTLKVLIVDDNRDGADALGLLVEALGHQVHVTYGGATALEVAEVFRPHLMFVDLLMPDMSGHGLVTRLRQNPTFVRTKIVAYTGQKHAEDATAAMQAGFDAVLFKSVELEPIKAVLASVVIADSEPEPKRPVKRARHATEKRLPIDEARKIRQERSSKALTQDESEAAICDGVVRFQEEFLGSRSDQVHTHLIKDLALIRIRGVLTVAERQLGKAVSAEKGRDLIKQTRKQLLELARPMLESLIHEVTGVRVLSMHHDISTLTGEEVILFSLTETPRFE